MLFHFMYFCCRVPSNPLWKKKRLTINNKKIYILYQIHLTTHKIEESVGMDVNTDTAALGSGVKTNDSITVTGKPTGGIQTQNRLYQSSHLLFGHKNPKPLRNMTGTGAGHNLHMGSTLMGKKKSPDDSDVSTFSPSHRESPLPLPQLRSLGQI